jgi:hypothetical protein
MELPASYRDVIEPLIANARTALEEGQSLKPTTFVGNFATQETGFVEWSTGDADAKDQTAFAIRMSAVELDADFVLSISESCSLARDKANRYAEIMEKYGSIKASPYWVDVLLFTLETRYGTWVGSGYPKPKGLSKKKRTFGEVVLERVNSMEGRFGKLLPPKLGQEAGESLPLQ